MAGSYFLKFRPFTTNLFYSRRIHSSISSHGRASFSSSKGNDSSNFSRENNYVIITSGKIVAGLFLTWGLFKYLRENPSPFSRYRLIDVLSNIWSVKALSVPNKDSSRNKFNFLADVVKETSPSVVYIEIGARHPITRGMIPMSNGSGFIIKSDGLILTNAHVVANQAHVTVKLEDGREFKGIVEDIDTEDDLATVRINADNLPVLKFGQSSDLRPGEFVIAMGNPLTLSHTITAGVISSTHRPSKVFGLHYKTDYIQTDAAINVGNSGGPLVNLDCEVIGINTMKVTEGISFAIPSDRAVEFLKRSEEKKKAKGWGLFSKEKSSTDSKRRYIGITMLTLTPQLIQELQQRNSDFPAVQRGVLVWRITLGSPAYEGGIRPGDIITNINDREVNSSKDIYKLLETTDELKMTIIRGKAKYTIVVHPQESLS